MDFIDDVKKKKEELLVYTGAKSKDIATINQDITKVFMSTGEVANRDLGLLEVTKLLVPIGETGNGAKYGSYLTLYDYNPNSFLIYYVGGYFPEIEHDIYFDFGTIRELRSLMLTGGHQNDSSAGSTKGATIQLSVSLDAVNWTLCFNKSFSPQDTLATEVLFDIVASQLKFRFMKIGMLPNGVGFYNHARFNFYQMMAFI